MEIQAIIALVTVVAAALQIILFFKLWGMTNDVREINEKINQQLYQDINNVRFKLITLFLLGKKKEAIELIIDYFYSLETFIDAKKRLIELFNIIHEPIPEIFEKSAAWTDINKFIGQGYDIYSKNIESQQP